MSDPRYVIAARSAAVAESWLREIDLPDAEHIHITRHPDGTITAVPMRPSAYLLDGVSGAWFDCPTGGDQ